MSSELESRGPDGYPHLFALQKWIDTHISHLMGSDLARARRSGCILEQIDENGIL